LAWRQHWLIADNAGALDLFHFSHAVRDNPMAADELYHIMAFVCNADGVEKKPQILLWPGAARVILRMDTHPYVSCSGFGRGHLFDRFIIADAVVSARSNFVFEAAGFSRSNQCLLHSGRTPNRLRKKQFILSFRAKRGISLLSKRRERQIPRREAGLGMTKIKFSRKL
jgi:hypothetical protein